jgi:hypothetical protein
LKTVVTRKLIFIPALIFLAGAGCSSDGNTTPQVPTTIEASSATSLTAVAGAVVSPAPSVIVRDQDGNALSGQTVVFAVASGGGSVTGASVVTDANGVATVGQWTLGKTAGPNSLTASSGSLSVTFNATGTAGPAASLTISAGNNQTAAAGSAVPAPPSVIVKDANGNAVSGATVTFAIGSGGGSVTGGSATSNSSGIATVGSWTLGAAAGANTLVASTNGAASVTFTATATVASKCDVRTPHTLGGISNGALESSDCQFQDGSFVDFYSVNIPTAGAYLFKQGAGFDAYLDIASADGSVIAENDNENSATTNSAIKAILPAGNYILAAGSLGAGVTGAYQISSQNTATDNANCDLMFVVRNVSTNQNIATDCQLSGSGSPIYADAFYILLRAGQSITVNMTSTDVDAYLQLVRRQNGATVAENDNKDATTKNAQLTFTATVTDYYAIVARTAVASQTGNYTLSIQ